MKRPATLLKKRLWHRCFPMNFAKFLRTPFLQNTSGRLLLSSLCTWYEFIFTVSFQCYKRISFLKNKCSDNFRKYPGKHQWWCLFFVKIFHSKQISSWTYSWEIFRHFQNYSVEHLWPAASAAINNRD